MIQLRRSLARCESGSTAVFFAFGSIVFLGMAALTADVGMLYYTQARLQASAEAAALAAAKRLPDQASAQAQGLSLAGKNVPVSFGTVTQSVDVQPGTFDSTHNSFVATTVSPNAVQVSAHRSAPNGNAVGLWFGTVFGSGSADVSAKAIALHAPPKTCLYALDPTAAAALDIKGSSIVTIQNCGVQVDSSSSQALNVSNNATLTAKTICVDGGASGSTSPPPSTGCSPKPDPLSYLPAPTPSTCVTAGSSGTFFPGTYCGNLTLSGATLNAGVYYIQGGALSFKGTVSGSGVMFYLDKNSSFSVTSSASINVSGPTSGTYKGIVFFQARDTPSSTTDTITGGGTILIDGTVYVPSAALKLAGSTGTANVGFVVANTVNTVGSTTFQITTTSGVVPDVFTRSYLVQ